MSGINSAEKMDESKQSVHPRKVARWSCSWKTEVCGTR